ncbi:glycosyl transferase family 2 [Flavobacterium sp. Root935]|jgi:glycosyltransferase involved in cell wall biosynthesis|uniref:glycosyltransferase family 2 protein n=1 Tax=unclassified Flavobacterium TaxID=196869 RepID=UPI00070EFB33|nr:MULTISPECIES: glycosyltransferase [unclassified Flavobacterium]KRD63875.1 glycosyl transferase family 2 [Flavobacterium sp. Root935]MDQ1167490.1 glycosyltransferase involved in cell wall biosynthesis [Flavobacterium sp. SORGH_AS_0622]
MISVVIRNKNQAEALSFLLKNLTERYADDIHEIIVIDNLSTDRSKDVTEQYKGRFVSIKNFSYGGSANLAAKEASQKIVVIFSAHSYPVSHDFFKLIKSKFLQNQNLAGLRCLHSTNDYRNFINNVSAKVDPNKSGLIFSGSAFNRDVWEKHNFRNDVATFEDKEWSKRVLAEGYDIEFVESIFHYEIKRTRKQVFFRFKNDMIGNYQLWHIDIKFLSVLKGLIGSLFFLIKNFIIDLYYAFLRFCFAIKFILNKPKKF